MEKQLFQINITDFNQKNVLKQNKLTKKHKTKRKLK